MLQCKLKIIRLKYHLVIYYIHVIFLLVISGKRKKRNNFSFYLVPHEFALHLQTYCGKAILLKPLIIELL